MPRKKGKLVSLLSSDEDDDTTSTIMTRSKMKRIHNKSTTNNTKNTMDIDNSDDDSFDIDKDNSLEPTKKVFRASRKIKHKPKHKKSTFCDTSDDDSNNESEQSLMSLSDSENNLHAPSATVRRRNLERFKNRIKYKNSDNISDDNTNNKICGKKRRKRDYDSDEYNEFVYDENIVETAWKDKDDNYDGTALECFYKTTLGLDSETDSDSENDSNYLQKPMKKRRKFMTFDRNKLKSTLATTQMKESFGTLPISEDIMCKISKYLTLLEISNILVFINHEFCEYFNTDKYWKKFYISLSKDIIFEDETKIIKQYKLKMNNDNKIYKRRLLWFFTRCEWREPSVFAELLKQYITAMPVNEKYKETYFVNRAFAIKIYLVRECIIMHYKKKCGYENTKYGIDKCNGIIYEELDTIMPKIEYSSHSKQFIAVWCDYKYEKLDTWVYLYNRFLSEWKTQDDVFNVFRFVNQMFIEYELNGMVKENVKDLEYLIELQGFYKRAMGNGKNVIKILCDDDSKIHDIIDIGDESRCDRIHVSIQSPKVILHEQIKYIMKFINGYDDDGYLNCKLECLMDEMKERNVISSKDEFENIKALIDRNQFKINKDSITCGSK